MTVSIGVFLPLVMAYILLMLLIVDAIFDDYDGGYYEDDPDMDSSDWIILSMPMCHGIALPMPRLEKDDKDTKGK